MSKEELGLIVSKQRQGHEQEGRGGRGGRNGGVDKRAPIVVQVFWDLLGAG